MSKYKIIAVAIAAALTAPAAFATEVVLGGGDDAAVLPSNVFDTATDEAINALTSVSVLADETSVYLGRTTGYNVRLTLSQGLFDGDPTVAVAGATDAVAIAGGGNNANTVTVAVTPDAVNGVVEGDGVVFPAGGIVIDAVAALGSGGSINGTIQVFDPVGGNQLGSNIQVTLIQTVQGWEVEYTNGGATQRIDVGSASAKRFFGNTTVGSGNVATVFNAGRILAGLNPDLDANLGLDPAVAEAELEVSGTNFAAFEDGLIYLSLNNGCVGSSAAGEISSDGMSVSFDPLPVSTINTHYICFAADGVTEIAAQDITASIVISQANTIDSPAFSSGDDLMGMMYNGPVIDVDHFNPASNADQQSYLRISNPSNTGGLVTIDGVCDDGTEQNPASLNLAAGASVLLTSIDVEVGNAAKGMTGGLGSCGGGKSRLTVTGEFAELKVQNFLRNVTSAGMINTNVNTSDVDFIED